MMVVALIAVSLSPLVAQQLLDRVVARVGASAITLTDVRAAIGLGIVEAPAAQQSAPGIRTEPAQAVVRQLIERRLALAEVARFPPPEPAAPAIEIEIARMKAHAGSGLDGLMRDTGLDEQRLRDMARDTLRIQGYVDQRFGTSVQVSEDDVRRYYDAHQQEFTSDGRQLSFESAEAAARQRASDERLRSIVGQWLMDLRARAEVVVPTADPR